MPSDVKPPGTVRVRLTIRPHEEIEVPEDEVPVLRMQGLLVEDETPGAGATVKGSGGRAGAGKDT